MNITVVNFEPRKEYLSFSNLKVLPFPRCKTQNDIIVKGCLDYNIIYTFSLETLLNYDVVIAVCDIATAISDSHPVAYQNSIIPKEFNIEAIEIVTNWLGKPFICLNPFSVSFLNQENKITSNLIFKTVYEDTVSPFLINTLSGLNLPSNSNILVYYEKNTFMYEKKFSNMANQIVSTLCNL